MLLALLLRVRLSLGLTASDYFHDPFFLVSHLLQSSSFFFLFPFSFALFREHFMKHHQVNIIRVPFISPSIYQNKPVQTVASQTQSRESAEGQRSFKVRLLALQFRLHLLLSNLSEPPFPHLQMGDAIYAFFIAMT